MMIDDQTGRVLAAALGLALVLGACDRGGGSSPEDAAGDDLVVEDVALPPDAQVDVTSDEREERRAANLGGQLPSDFPALPLYPGSTIVDLAEEGDRYRVTFLAPKAVETVTERYLGDLNEQGWRGDDGVDEGGFHRLSKEGTTVGVAFQAHGPSTQIVVEY